LTLKQKTISGISWNGAGNIAHQVIQVVSLLVMARFLSPDDFGVYAILLIFINFMGIFGAMGTTEVVIYMDNPDQRMLSSIFYFNVAIGAVLFVLLYFLAWPIASFFDNQRIVHLLQIIGSVFIISSLSLLHRSLLEKHLLFKQVVILEMTALTIGSIAGIIAAVSGLGIYSLLIAGLSRPSIFTVGLWLTSQWRPSLVIDFGDIKKVWRYAFNLTGFSIINYFSRNADNLLIGKFIGSSALGLYSVAYRIMLYPLDNIARVLIRVLFPAFSQVKHDNARFKNGYLKAITFTSLVSFPLMAGLVVVSESFVSVFLGDKWVGMASLLVVLAPVGMIQSIVTTTGSIYTAKGTTGLLFKIGTINAVVTVLSFVIGLSYGVIGVAVAYAVANAVMVYPNLRISWHQVDLGVLEGLGKLAPFFISAGAMAIAVYFQGIWLIDMGMSHFLVLPLQVTAGITIYLAILMLFYRTLLLGLLAELRGKKSQVELAR